MNISTKTKEKDKGKYKNQFSINISPKTCCSIMLNLILLSMLFYMFANNNLNAEMPTIIKQRDTFTLSNDKIKINPPQTTIQNPTNSPTISPTKPPKNNKPFSLKITKIDALKTDEFISTNPEKCHPNTPNDNVLIFDAMPLHSVSELHLIAIRIFELCHYVDLFVIMEIMHYPNGQRRNESIWEQREKYLNLTKMLNINACNMSKIIHHKIYKNVYVQGYNLGKGGEQLQRVYFDEFRRNKLIDLVYENCFKYFGDTKCVLQNMDNVYIILSDTDEIPRNAVLKLLKHCQLPPMSVTIRWQAYDFGCHLNKDDVRLVKILSLKHVSADVREETGARWMPTQYAENKGLSEITMVANGGWHLTYFGDVADIIEKNQHKAHLFFHGMSFTEEHYQRCAWEICSYYVHGDRSRRIESVNVSDPYYPLFVQQNLSEGELNGISPFFNMIINVEPGLYERWKVYWNKNRRHGVKEQKAYCLNESRTHNPTHKISRAWL